MLRVIHLICSKKSRLGAIILILLLFTQDTSIYAADVTRSFGPSYASLTSRDYPMLVTAKEKGATRLSKPSAIPSGAAHWQSYPIYGGEAISIDMDPTDPQVIYVGMRDAGIFKTTDGGQSWQPARDGLTFYPIRCLKVDPYNHNNLYAGTDYDGIWKSINGGASWSKASAGLDEGDMIVFNLVFDPTTPNSLYAGLAGGFGLGIGNVYKSEDGGTTWGLKDNGIPRQAGRTNTDGILALAVNPNQNTHLVAGTNTSGAFQTTDGGETWSAINDGLSHSYGDHYYSINAVAFDPHHAGRLTGIVDGKYYAYSGGAWQLASQVNEYANGPLFNDYLYYHPTNPSIIYGAGVGVYKSADAGLTWSVKGGSKTDDVANLAFSPESPDLLYAPSNRSLLNMGGVYSSTDAGETWESTSAGIQGSIILSVAIDPEDENSIYAGDADGFFFSTHDGGTTWQNTFLDFEPTHIQIDPLNSRTIYLLGGQFLKSTDQGVTFTPLSAPKTVASVIAMSPHMSNPIYVGGEYGISKSMDGGNTWMTKTQGLPSFGGSLCPILALEVDPTHPDTLWAGTQHGGIVRSIDGGDHWAGMGLTQTTEIDAVAINPLNSNEILAGGGYGFGPGKIYRSTDGGQTWTEQISDIAFVQQIVYDPRNPRWVYAATEGYGVLRSFNGGQSWSEYNAGIFYPVLYSIAISQGNSPLLVTGSYGSGLYGSHPPAIVDIYLPLLVR